MVAVNKTYSLVPNKRRGPNSRGWEIFRKSNIRGGPNKRGGGKLGNPYLKIRYKVMFFIPILKPIHSFSKSI